MMPVALCVVATGMLMIALVPPSAAWLLAPTFFFARGGAKCMTSPYRSAVLNQWFYTKRGKATATIIIAQQCLTNFVICPLYGVLLLHIGWRQASFIGVFLCLGFAPLFALLLFHTPESVGLLPDGKDKVKRQQQYTRLDEEGVQADEADEGGGAKHEREQLLDSRTPEKQPAATVRIESSDAFSFTRAEAFRTLPVWLLMFDGFCAAIIGVGCSQSLLQVLTDNGAVGVDISIHVVMANGAAQMIQPLLAGYARDHGVPPRYILSLSAALVATVPLLQTLITSPFYAILYGMNMGSTWGLKSTIVGTVYADFYGRKHLGQITSFDAMFNTMGTAIGPLIFSAFRAYFGSYNQVLYLFSIPPLISSILSFCFLKKPSLPPRATSIYGRGSIGMPPIVPRQLVQSSGGVALSPS